jgi:4-hydroxy-3-polyprenylbenzoate decarboxylase
MSDSILSLAAPPADARIAYGSDPNQFLDLRLPKKDPPTGTKKSEKLYPLVINIHGGYWRARYNLDHAGHLCAALAAKGVATANLEYRRVGNEGGGWPNTFADIRAGELKRIKAEADPILEIAEITDRVSKWGPRGSHGPGGPALLFENVKGHPGAKVLINQFGSERRMTMALDVDSLDEIADRIKMFMDVKSPQGLLDKIKMLPMLAEMGKFFPKKFPLGPCKEVIKRDNFSLHDFPILQCWPLDGGRFITLPSVITKDPKTGKRNAGTYRLQVYDAQAPACTGSVRSRAPSTIASRCDAPPPCGEANPVTAALDMMARSGGGSRVAEGKQVAGRMEVAVAIGTEPAVMFSSIVPAPPDVEEYLIAGFLRRSRSNW